MPSKSVTNYLRSVVLLGSGLGMVYAVETSVTHFFGDQTLAPLLSILYCAILIFIASPRAILAGIPFFAVLTYFLIVDSSRYPFIRTSTMILGGGLAYLVSRQKQKLEGLVAETDLILSKINTPWMLCDRSGNIRRISASASHLVQTSTKDLEGVSFFSKFNAGPSRGELIQKFLKAADSRIAVDQVGLILHDHPDSLVDASFIPVQTKEGVCILIIFITTPTIAPA